MREKRSRRKQFITDFLEGSSQNVSRRNMKCDSTRLSVFKALENMAKAGVHLGGYSEESDDDIETRQQCFARELCIRMLEEQRARKSNHGQRSAFQYLVNEFETLFLMYHQLSDRSIAFIDFLDNIRNNDEPKYFVSCYDMFPNC